MYEELGATIFCRDKRYSYRDKNKIAGSKLYRTLSKSVVTKSKKKLREQVAKENLKLRQKLRQRPKTLSRHNFLCRDRATNLGHKIGDPQHRLEVQPNIGKSINRRI